MSSASIRLIHYLIFQTPKFSAAPSEFKQNIFQWSFSQEGHKSSHSPDYRPLRKPELKLF